MVSPMRDNAGDDKGWDEKVISTAMDAGSSILDMVKMCKCVGVWKVMCQCVGV